jgi:hypothetical protein
MHGQQNIKKYGDDHLFTYLFFICGLFNSDVNKSDFILSNNKSIRD